MLLETKNIQENDIIIYSRNSMDENYNFRIVFKNDPHTHHRIISFEHVKKLITEYFPKNLIAYRILCNFSDITIGKVNYGCVIMVDNVPELIFTDPVFAVQTIEEYIEHNHNIDFRFKIQQIGYTTLNKVEEKANFQEEFIFDLKMGEAINQNDEIFVNPIIEKRIFSRKQKKSGREIKRDIIFKPENQKSIEFIEEDKGPAKTKKNDTKELSNRNERVAGGKINKEEEYQKVQSSTPVTIRKVEINENGSQTHVELEAPKNHKDDLFSNFLNNLQSESISKVKKKKKRYKESDIIQMFKSLQSGNSNQDGDQNTNIILTSGKNGKLK